MKSLKRFSCVENQEYKTVELLAGALRGEHGKHVTDGQTKLVLTVASLACLNKKLRSISCDDFETSEIVTLNSEHAAYSHHDNKLFLQQFIRNVLTLKVAPGSGTVQGCVNLAQFHNLKCLEIERVPIHLLKGLHCFRSQLRIISCRRCVRSLHDLFSFCGGDHSVPLSWSSLLAVRLSYNDIKSLDDSLKLLSSVVSLDLSYNNISSTEGIQFLSKLEHLNLSYNSLNKFPSELKSCLKLKILLLKNNCIESLMGLEYLENLQKIDLSYNFFIDHCALKPFESLTELIEINLTGSPISYHRSHRMLTLKHLHRKSMSVNTKLDGSHFTDVEIRDAGTLTCGSCANSVPMQLLENQVDRDKGSLASHSEADRQVESISEFVENSDFIGKRQLKKKTGAVREAQINEEQSAFIINSVEPVEIISSEHLQTRHEIEMCRKQHGKEWLIIGTRLNMLPNISHDDEVQAVNEQIRDKNEVLEAQSSSVTDPLARRSQVSDDVIVLPEEPEGQASFELYNMPNLQIDNASEMIPQLSNFINENIPSEEEDADDGTSQPFIVHMEKPGSDEDSIILLVIKNNELREKDFITGRTIESLDLRCIQSFDILSPKKSMIDDNECKLPRLRITFNHVRKDRRERIYLMEDEKSYKEFCSLMQPIADANTFKEATAGALQCLKCHSVFSKEMVSKVLLNTNQADDVTVLSSSADTYKDTLHRVNVCPNCLSQMIIEVDAVSTLKITANEMIPLNQSTPVSSSLINFENKDKLNGALGSSCPTVIKANDWSQSGGTSCSFSNSTSDYKTDVGFYNSSSSVSNNFAVEVEVHHSSNQELRNVNLQRWESDITILSNPSQSSIMVLAHQASDNNLVAIPEHNSSLQLAETASESLLLNPSGASSRTLAKMNSCSSDSLSDSTCTAVETLTRYNSAHTRELAQTPESYLSAFSEPNEVKIDAQCSNVEREDFSVVSHVPHQFDKNSGNPLPLLWSCRDSDIVYSFIDFNLIDHRLKLYLNMNVLDDDEEAIILLRAGIISYSKDNEFSGLIVMTHSRIYIMKLTSEKEFSPNWLQKVDCLSANTLAHLNVHLGGQAFQMEFACKTGPICYIILLRDDDHCNSFVCYVIEKLKSGAFDIDQSKLTIDLDSEETLQLIREQLFLWRNSRDSVTNSSSLTTPVDNDEANVYFYIMCYWLCVGDESTYRPISVVVTRTDIFLFSENLLWPLPHLISPSSDLLNRPQLIPQIREKIQDLISITKIENRPFEVILKFLDEDSGDELDIRIATETQRSLQMMIQTLKDPWEKLFGMELQICHLQES